MTKGTARSAADHNIMVSLKRISCTHRERIAVTLLMLCIARFILHEKQTMRGFYDEYLSETSSSRTSCQMQTQMTMMMQSLRRTQTNGSNTSVTEYQQQHSQQPPVSTICQALSHGALTASSLWKANLQNLLQASLHPLDQERKVHQYWQEQLLQVLTPNILERTVINMPNIKQVKDILTIIDARRKYLYINSQPSRSDNTTDSVIPPPPLQVAVMGGSVPEGRECESFPESLKEWMANISGFTGQEQDIRGKECSWPYRLQLLADYFLGKDVVVVHNLAVGGTNSMLALPTLEYRLYRSQELIEHGGPDVIINGFAVNDNLPPWGTDPNTTSRTDVWDGVSGLTQSFLNYGLHKSKSCQKPKPVVIFLDDYLGNQNADVLLGEDVRSDNVRMIADLNGLLYVSASYPIKHYVMANERETTFSPQWRRGLKRITEGHYYQTGHQHVALSLAYAFLKTAVEHCVMDEYKTLAATEESTLLTRLSKRMLQKHPFPPVIDHSSTLSSISHAWETNADEITSSEAHYCQSADAKANPCPFGFVATPAGTTPNQGALSRYLTRFVTENTGWRAVHDMRFGWQNKIGFVANTVGASVLLTIRNIENPIRLVTLHFMKSYGEKWIDSAARFDIHVYESEEDAAAAIHQPELQSLYNHSFTLEGGWEQEFSINVHETINLAEDATKIGNTVTLRMTLIGGQEFKIVTLLMCSR